MYTHSTTPAPIVVDTRNLSADAVSYLRGLVAKRLREGMSKREAASYANRWAAGYRTYHLYGYQLVFDAPAIDGYEWAKGEEAYWRCMEVDAAQDSAAAAGYPHLFF